MAGQVHRPVRAFRGWTVVPLLLATAAALLLAAACGSGRAKEDATPPPEDTATVAGTSTPLATVTATAVPAAPSGETPAAASDGGSSSDSSGSAGAAQTGRSRPAPSYDQGPAAGSGDRLVIPSIGVNAPVTMRVVGPDGAMGNPNGPEDVVWYDFSAYAGLGGYPGNGGNAVYAGHVNYRNYGAAVFANIESLGPGDLIEVYRGDGQVISYSVQWTTWAEGEGSNFTGYVQAEGFDEITLVTCVGTWDPGARQYSNRLVVRGKRI